MLFFFFFFINDNTDFSILLGLLTVMNKHNEKKNLSLSASFDTLYQRTSITPHIKQSRPGS